MSRNYTLFTHDEERSAYFLPDVKRDADTSVVKDGSEWRKFTPMNDTDLIRDRMREALRTSGQNATQVAVKMGRDRNYLRDFLKTPPKKKSIAGQDLALFAQLTNSALEWVSGTSKAQTRSAVPDGPPSYETRKRIPLLGQALAGEDGSFQMNGEILAELPAPPEFETVRLAYAVSVSGESMLPRYRPGEIAYVNPSRSPRRGDDVVVQVKRSGELIGYIKELVNISGERITLQQLNPPKKISFDRNEVESIHVIAFATR